MTYRIKWIDPIGNINVTEQEAESKEQALYLFTMENPLSMVESVEEVDERAV